MCNQFRTRYNSTQNTENQNHQEQSIFAHGKKKSPKTIPGKGLGDGTVGLLPLGEVVGDLGQVSVQSGLTLVLCVTHPVDLLQLFARLIEVASKREKQQELWRKKTTH